MRSMFIGSVLALATLFAAASPAMAGENDGKEKVSFPMPAAQFQAKVTAREVKAREHMEKRAATLDADKAKELRAKFDAGEAKINAEVAKATADGTVTKEEAKEVRQVTREVRGHHGKHAKNRAPAAPKTQ